MSGINMFKNNFLWWVGYMKFEVSKPMLLKFFAFVLINIYSVGEILHAFSWTWITIDIRF